MPQVQSTWTIRLIREFQRLADPVPPLAKISPPGCSASKATRRMRGLVTSSNPSSVVPRPKPWGGVSGGRAGQARFEAGIVGQYGAHGGGVRFGDNPAADAVLASGIQTFGWRCGLPYRIIALNEQGGRDQRVGARLSNRTMRWPWLVNSSASRMPMSCITARDAALVSRATAIMRGRPAAWPNSRAARAASRA